MNDFNEIVEIWDKQPDHDASGVNQIIEEAKKIRAKIKKNHFWTKFILIVTVAILIAFFASVSAHNSNRSFAAAFIMVTVILIRIFLEYISWNKYKNLDETKSLNVYIKQASSFYKWRKKIHILYTPLIILLYVLGFVLLMPFFKSGLSEGFYTYIKVSGTIVLLGLSFFIFKQIKKELKMLKFLENVFDDE